jgi:hypothetical protein
MPFFLYLIALFALGYWRFAPALLEPGRTLAAIGDANGTTGWITEVSRQFQELGWSVFAHGDLVLHSNIGIGLLNPTASVNPFWRLMYIVLGELIPVVDDRYDMSVVVMFVLTGLTAWPFARLVGLRPTWAAVFCVFILTVENSFRIHSHNGLSYLWAPLLGLWASLYFSNKPNFGRAGLLAFTWWLVFLGSEYFAYFLLFAAPALIVGCHWKNFKENHVKQVLRFLKLILPWAPMVIALVCLSHPAVTWWRIFPPTHITEQGAKSPPALNSRPKHQLNLYALKNTMAWISPGLIVLPEWLNQSVFQNGIDEFSFRLGPVLFLFLLAVWRFRHKNKKQIILEWKESSAPPLRPWLTMAGVMALMGLSTQYVVSGIWITMLIAPVFRVSVRAHAYTMIGVLLVFFLIIQWIFTRYKKPQIRMGIVLIIVLVLFDMTWPRSVVLSPYTTYPNPPLNSLVYGLSAHHRAIGSPSSATLYLGCHQKPEHCHYMSFSYAAIHRLPVISVLSNQIDLWTYLTDQNKWFLKGADGNVFYAFKTDVNSLARRREFAPQILKKAASKRKNLNIYYILIIRIKFLLCFDNKFIHQYKMV